MNKIFIFLFLSPCLLAQTRSVRGELHRYTLVRDRIIIERSLRKRTNESFFDLEVSLSSGTKSFYGDIVNAADDANSSADKTANILAILNQNINTERYVDIDLNIGIPFPFAEIRNVKVLPALFLNNNISASLSMNNNTDATNPIASTYFKYDRKLGAQAYLFWKKKNGVELRAYQNIRKDQFLQRSSSEIADSGKIIDLDSLEQTETSYMFDLLYELNDHKRNIQFSAQEIALNSHGAESDYTGRPILNLRYMQYLENSRFKLNPFVGLHFRQYYAAIDGLYGGIDIRWKEIPFKFLTMLDNGFFTVAPQFHGEIVRVTYSVKLAHKNPQDYIWVPAIHTLNMHFPF